MEPFLRIFETRKSELRYLPDISCVKVSGRMSHRGIGLSNEDSFDGFFARVSNVSI